MQRFEKGSGKETKISDDFVILFKENGEADRSKKQKVGFLNLFFNINLLIRFQLS